MKPPLPHVKRMYELRSKLLRKKFSVDNSIWTKTEEAEYNQLMSYIEAEEERLRIHRLGAMWTVSGQYLGAVENLLDNPTDENYDKVRSIATNMR